MPVDMKAKIAETLYELLKHKPLDKITVKELVDTCNISRQSFYYHFQDIMSGAKTSPSNSPLNGAWRLLPTRKPFGA